MRARRERRDREGRHVLPAHRQEASARAGGGAAESAPVHLPRRLGRRLPAAPSRGVPRPRALRPDLLQPGPALGARDSPDRGGHGLVHRRWRLRAGDVRRDDHRQGNRHDLHRRPTAREGRDGPGRDRGGARRCRRPHAPLRGGRPLRDLGRACARAGAPDRAASAHDAPTQRRGRSPNQSRRRSTQPT